MMNLKKLLAAGLCFAMLLTLAACASGTAGTSAAASASAAASSTAAASSAAASSAAASASSAAASGSTSAEGKTLIMATNAEFPPYEYMENDKVTGIDADIAQAICDKLGATLQIDNM